MRQCTQNCSSKLLLKLTKDVFLKVIGTLTSVTLYSIQQKLKNIPENTYKLL